MMDVKLRVHDGKQMHYCTLSSYPNLVNSHEQSEHNSTWIKMLSTNRFDCHNRLIYFGDIVEFVDSQLQKYCRYKVGYDMKTNQIVLTMSDDKVVHRDVKFHKLKVVGNFIDDAHLLS